MAISSGATGWELASWIVTICWALWALCSETREGTISWIIFGVSCFITAYIAPSSKCVSTLENDFGVFHRPEDRIIAQCGFALVRFLILSFSGGLAAGMLVGRIGDTSRIVFLRLLCWCILFRCFNWCVWYGQGGQDEDEEDEVPFPAPPPDSDDDFPPYLLAKLNAPTTSPPFNHPRPIEPTCMRPEPKRRTPWWIPGSSNQVPPPRKENFDFAAELRDIDNGSRSTDRFMEFEPFLKYSTDVYPTATKVKEEENHYSYHVKPLLFSKPSFPALSQNAYGQVPFSSAQTPSFFLPP